MSKDFFDQYSDPQWQQKRLAILNRDGWRCKFCGKSKSILHVHHKHYAKDIPPWEYPDSDLITLCDPCHNKVHERIEFIKRILGRMSLDQLDITKFILLEIEDLEPEKYKDVLTYIENTFKIK